MNDPETSHPLPGPCHTGGSLALPEWYQRAYAWLLMREDTLHDRVVGPKKRVLFSDLSGTILELGPGGGINLGYLASAGHWIGLEPNVYFHPHLRKRARDLGISAEIRTGVAESIPAPDSSMDAVIGTLVLCSVRNLPLALSEVLRVLRPGGLYCFLEHVAAPRETGLCLIQRGIRPVWRLIAGGCRPDLDTAGEIESAGFAEVRIERFKVAVPITAPHIAGRARKPVSSAHRGGETNPPGT